MKIVDGYPPNIDKIKEAFDVFPGVMFCYGDTIYAPGIDKIPAQLRAHEKVHSVRQLERGVEEWWDLYIKDSGFRFNEELLAHRKEYHTWVALNVRTWKAAQREEALDIVAKRLSGNLYGKMVSLGQAKAAIRRRE